MLTLIKFGAVWCNPCKAYSVILNELNKEHNGKFVFKEVDVEEDTDEATNLVSKFGIRSVPTTVILDGDEVKFKRAGVITKEELVNLLNL